MARLAVWFFAFSCAIYAMTTVWVAIALPEGPIPTHWSSLGDAPADGWSSPSGAVWFLVLLGAFLAALFGGLLFWFSRSTTMTGLNVPNLDFWTRPENIAEVRRRSTIDVSLMAGTMMLVMAAIGPSILIAAHDPEHRSPVWFDILMGVWVVGILAHAFWMARSRYRIPPENERNW